jgi:hypothetical protein
LFSGCYFSEKEDPMSRKLTIFLLFAICIILGGSSIVKAQGTEPPLPDTELATPLGTAFTYQGRLKDAGGGVTGTCDFRFNLYASSWDSDQVGTSQDHLAVEVEDGFFTVADLDFGADAFNGEARWLGIAVRCPAGAGTYEHLKPRQALTAAPYALYTPGTHDHLGQTWTGANNPLKIEGTYDTFPDNAPLVLDNSSGTGAGLLVSSAGDGVYVSSAVSHGLAVGQAGGDGLFVFSTGDDGVSVNSAAGDGFSVGSAGNNGVYVGGAGADGVLVDSADVNGVLVSSAGMAGFGVVSAGGNGVYVGEAGSDGVLVNSATGDGFSVNSAIGDGFYVGSAGGYGLHVGESGSDGLRVDSAGEDGLLVVLPASNGLQVIGAGNDGVYVVGGVNDGISVDSVGGDGVVVDNAVGNGLWVGGPGLNGAELWNSTYDGVQVNQAGRYGVQANTNADYGLYTPDAIYVGGGCVGCFPMLIAQNGDDTPLEPGDLVALEGLTDPFNPESVRPVLVVREADAPSHQSIIGVVEGHYVYEETVWPTTASDSLADETSFSLRMTESIHLEPAAPGEYLVVVYHGMVKVKVNASGGPIQAGDLLSVADTPGYAALARPVALESAVDAGIYPNGTIIGKALEPLDGDTGFIWVLVDLQ